MIAQLSHWRTASAAAALVLAGSSAVALSIHNAPADGYQSVPSSPAPRRDPAAPQTAAERAGQTLLAQAVAACRATPFSGVQVFRSWGQSGTRVWRADIWHRPGGQLVADPVVHGETALAGSAGAPGPSVSTSLSGQQLALMRTGYVLDYAGRSFADGRPAAVVTAARPDGTLAARFWLDEQTRLPLRRQLFDNQARVVSDISIAALRTGPGSLRGMPAAEPQLVLRQLGAAEIAGLQARGWPLPAQLPGGMALFAASETTAPAGQVVGVSYSDGLSVISLFVQRGQLPGQLPGWQHISKAGRAGYAVDLDDQAIAWSADGYVFTLLADAPAAAVSQAIAALPQGGQPGIWTRLGRGFRRLGSWLNPFR